MTSSYRPQKVPTDVAAAIMVFVEGLGGPGMQSLRGDGAWGSAPHAGASFFFSLSRSTRDELALAYFWHAYGKLIARAPWSSTVGGIRRRRGQGGAKPPAAHRTLRGVRRTLAAEALTRGEALGAALRQQRQQHQQSAAAFV